MKIKDFVQQMNLRLKGGDFYKLNVQYDSENRSYSNEKRHNLQWSLIYTDSKVYSRKVHYGPCQTGEDLLNQVTTHENLSDLSPLEVDGIDE